MGGCSSAAWEGTELSACCGILRFQGQEQEVEFPWDGAGGVWRWQLLLSRERDGVFPVPSLRGSLGREGLSCQLGRFMARPSPLGKHCPVLSHSDKSLPAGRCGGLVQVQGGPLSVLWIPLLIQRGRKSPGVVCGASPHLRVQLLTPSLSLLEDSLPVKGDGQRV